MSRHRRALAVLCGVVFMTVVDLSVVNVALPAIQRALDVAPADLQWIVVAYGMALGGSLLVGGRIGDRIGHRRALIGGLMLLTLASLAASLAASLVSLVAARAAQGLGGALAAPNALALLTTIFAEGPERNRALGVFGAAGGVGAVAGSVLGGLLVQAAGWRWVFLINLPVGIAVAGLAMAWLPPARFSDVAESLDLPGAATLTAGLMLEVLALHASVTHAWDSAATLLPSLAGLALLTLFAARERRAAVPLIPLARVRPVASANLATALLWGSFLAQIYAATLFTQEALHWSPLAAGSAGLTIAFVSLIVSERLAPLAAQRFGGRGTLGVGLLLVAAGQLWLGQAPPGAGYWSGFFGPYAVIGVGIGLAQVASQIAAFTGVAGRDSGLAGGLVETSGELGGAIGVALITVLSLRAQPSTSGQLELLASEFHRAMLGCVVLAVAGAAVASGRAAFTQLRISLRPRSARPRRP